jgi:hypothetical protein
MLLNLLNWKNVDQCHDSVVLIYLCSAYFTKAILANLHIGISWAHGSHLINELVHKPQLLVDPPKENLE